MPAGSTSAPPNGSPVVQPGGIAGVRAYFADTAGTAAKFLARPDGPRVGAIVFDGWDTHVNEGPVKGRLTALLSALDDAMGAIAANMGDAWHETVVVVVTEFGRTVHMNGNGGTDHGTATVALLAGGAVKGGRIVADWPGLKDADLYQSRDLRPTTDLRAVMKGLLKDHLGVSELALAAQVFPDSRPPAHAPTRTSARPATTMSPALNSPTPSAVTALRPQRLSSRSSPDPTEGDSLMRRRSNRRRRCNNTLYFDVQ